MPLFPGSGFALEQVRQISVAALRVRYTQDPRALDPTHSDDGLNPNNYDLSGPDENFVVGVSSVDGDLQSLDLYLAAPLSVGSWTISVENVVEDTSESLMDPTTLGFEVTFTMTSDPLGHGAVNEEQENVLRKFLNPALKGQGWTSMIAALAVGDQQNADNARLAFDQLFLSTAGGAYLDRRASDEGIHRPKGVNMSDDLFRQLALTQKNGKLTQKALLDVLEIFYGRDATRASSDTAEAEFYGLQDGDDLAILFEERNTVTVMFERSHFTRIGVATAEEVAAAITRACRDAGNAGFAVSFADSISGENKVRIYSGTLGLTSSVRITGGRGNLALLFPTPLFTDLGTSPYATWDVTFSPSTQGSLRFTMTSGTQYNLFEVQTGDLVYIYGPEFEVSANGTYPITNIFVTASTKWFEIDNPLGVEASGVSQVQFNDLAFFRPKRKTIYDNTRRVIVCENDGYLDIIIPATTEVVGRGPGLAAYLNEVTPLNGIALSLTRIENGYSLIDVGAPHNLSAGDQIYIDGAQPDGTLSTIDAATPSTDFPGADSTAAGVTAASRNTTITQTGTYDGVQCKAVRDSQGRLLVLGGWTTADGTTVVPKTGLVVLEKTGETVGVHFGRAVDFLWTQVSDDGMHGFSGYNSGPRAFSASLMLDGRILMVGGTSSVTDFAGGFATQWDALQFISPNMVSQQTGGLPAIGAGHAQASDLFINQVVVCGGYTASAPIASTVLFDGSLDGWSGVSDMHLARMYHELVAIGVDFLAIGGMANGDGSTWINSSDGITIDHPVPHPGIGRTSILGTLNYCETYNVIDDTWTMTGNMTYCRAKFSTVTIPDGRVIVFGGRGYLPDDLVTAPKVLPRDLSSVEIYDPNTRLWSNLPSMKVARVSPVCTYMPVTNEIWVTSGANDKRTEVLDVATMKWKVSAQAQLTHAHDNATGGLLDVDLFTMIGGGALVATEKVNYVIVPGADKVWYAAGLNAEHRVDTVIDANQFTIKTPDFTGGTTKVVLSPTIVPERAVEAPITVPGPFSYDVRTGFAITATAGVTDTVFNKGVHYSSMHLTGFDSALAFPDAEGWLVFNFGYANAVGPIRYLGRPSDSDLILDAAVPFSASLPAGASVRLLKGRTPYEPAADRLVGSFYVTGTAAGREAARQIIDDIIAAGKQVLVTVIYPGDRGLGAEGFPQGGNYKLSDVVSVWGGDHLDTEIPAARKGP